MKDGFSIGVTDKMNVVELAVQFLMVINLAMHLSISQPSDDCIG